MKFHCTKIKPIIPAKEKRKFERCVVCDNPVGKNKLFFCQEHRDKDSPEYVSWDSMIQRTTNPRDDAYSYYGGRGIGVCTEWFLFENFFKDMGKRPTGYSIERIDVNKGYCKENCKWIAKSEQSKNTRRTVRMTHEGKEVSTIKNIAELTGLTKKAVERRLASGRSIEEMIKAPFGIRLDTMVEFRGVTYRNYRHLADTFGVNFNTFSCRFHHRRWTLEQALLTDNSNKGGMGKKKFEGTR